MIWVCIRQLTAPLVQKFITQFRADKRRAMVAMNVLDELLDNDTRRAPRFLDADRGMRATKQRDVALQPFKPEAEYMSLSQYDADDYSAATHARDLMKAALVALQTDPNAELPKL